MNRKALKRAMRPHDRHYIETQWEPKEEEFTPSHIQTWAQRRHNVVKAIIQLFRTGSARRIRVHTNRYSKNLNDGHASYGRASYGRASHRRASHACIS